MTSNNKLDIEEQYGIEAPLLVPASPTSHNSFKVDVILRLSLLASTLIAIVLLITSSQTIRGTTRGLFPGPMEAKFSYAPAFVCLLSTLSVVGFYSIITMLVSIFVILKPKYSSKTNLLIFFIIWDVLLLGMIDSAVGAAGGVAYLGWKGNGHSQRLDFCSVFDKFCGQVGASLAASLLASLLLVFLAWHNIDSLQQRICG